MNLRNILATVAVSSISIWSFSCGDAALTGKANKKSQRETIAGQQVSTTQEDQRLGADADGKPCLKLALGNPNEPGQTPPNPGKGVDGGEPNPPPPSKYPPCSPTQGPVQGPGVDERVDIDNTGKGPDQKCTGLLCKWLGGGKDHGGCTTNKGGEPCPPPPPPPGPVCPNTPKDKLKGSWHHGKSISGDLWKWGGGKWQKGPC